MEKRLDHSQEMAQMGVVLMGTATGIISKEMEVVYTGDGGIYDGNGPAEGWPVGASVKGG